MAPSEQRIGVKIVFVVLYDVNILYLIYESINYMEVPELTTW